MCKIMIIFAFRSSKKLNFFIYLKMNVTYIIKEENNDYYIKSNNLHNNLFNNVNTTNGYIPKY